MADIFLNLSAIFFAFLKMDYIMDQIETKDILGVKIWHKAGKVHRDGDLPAVVSVFAKEWRINGKRHRDNNLPAVIWSDGTKEWWVNGKFIKLSYLNHQFIKIKVSYE